MAFVAVSVIFLAGGVGARMGAPVPKQFLSLRDRPVALHAFDVFAVMPEITEIVVVCDPAYQHLFHTPMYAELRFALPGARRQDSLRNGVTVASSATNLFCIHDSVRPFITSQQICQVLEVAAAYGAALLAVPQRSTIKEIDTQGFMRNTPDRSVLWEAQTPQALAAPLMHKGLRLAQARNIVVTDDVALAELCDCPAKAVLGSYRNIKLTSPDDLSFANWVMNNGSVGVVAASDA